MGSANTPNVTTSETLLCLPCQQVCKDPSRKASGKKVKSKLTQDPAARAAASDAVDCEKKILHMSWHPQDDVVAVAGNDKLYIYSAVR